MGDADDTCTFNASSKQGLHSIEDRICFVDHDCAINSPDREGTTDNSKVKYLPSQGAETTEMVVYAVFHVMYPYPSCAIQLYVPFRNRIRPSSNHAVSHAGSVGRPIIILLEMPPACFAVDLCSCSQAP